MHIVNKYIYIQIITLPIALQHQLCQLFFFKHVASMRKERSKAKPKAVRATSPEEFDG